MNSELVTAIIGIYVLAVNCFLLFMIFPSRIDLRISVMLLTLFTGVHMVFLFMSGPVSFSYGGLRAFIYFPILLFLLKGPIFQKLFAFSLELVLTVTMFIFINASAGYFFGNDGLIYNIVRLLAAFVVYTCYAVLAGKRQRTIYEKLFAYGRMSEWALYSFVGLFSLMVMAVSSMAVTNTAYLFLILSFILLSFGVLCFAIINTHEKSKRQYEAEFAQGIISSGREHYQKMDEMYIELRTLRHDYKYHLSTIGELLATGDKEEISRYLDDIQTQFSKIEMPMYCQNSVINALLASYAERCVRLNIKYEAAVVLPEPLPIPNYEMCIVLGNLLENAVEACLMQQVQDKKIQLLLKPVAGELALRVRNSASGLPYVIDGRIRSTKKDGGFGIRSVEAVTARYGGELLTEWNENTFTAYVAVRL